MDRIILQFIFVLCYACSLGFVGVYGESTNLEDMSPIRSTDNRHRFSEIKRTIKTQENKTRNLEDNQSQKNERESPHLENNSKLNEKTTRTRKVIAKSLPNRTSSSTNVTQTLKAKDEKTFKEGKAAARTSEQKIDNNKVKVRNEAIGLEVKSKITKNSGVLQTTSKHGPKKRAKKLLASFFNSEVEDTPKDLHRNKTVANDSEEIKDETKIEAGTKKHVISTNKKTQEIYKRTRLLTHTIAPLVTYPKQGGQVIDTVLPSRTSLNSPQHVQGSNQPTHVMFKPVHKYYPAIHRYMTRPIHRYLKKPVNLGGLAAPQLASPRVMSPHVQVFPPQGQQVGVPQGMIPGQFVAAPRPGQGGVNQVPPVRMYDHMTPRIQPVLEHPHRLSISGFGPCSTNPCKNSGVCSSVSEEALCVCRPGFRGKFCELINHCHPNPCHNFGKCNDVPRDFECTCKEGYRGKKCEVENKCEPNPCINGGTCSENEDDYVCTCREGFLGHSCETESKCNPINPCKNGASCQEAIGTYKCFCREGFAGYNCEARVMHDRCSPNPCSHGGFCTITGTSTGNYTCSCLSGWKGRTCVEKVDNWGNSAGPNLCESVNPCMFGGKCTPGSYYDYTCACPSGRGGSHCEHNLVQHKPLHTCSQCHAFARCLIDRCKCNEGYEGDGQHCAPVEQYCHPNPCYNGGVCRELSKQKQTTPVVGQNKWWCECSEGYKGTNCQEMDLCHMHLCQNGGSCTAFQGQTSCRCPKSYIGKYCEEKDVCHANPCRNGGSCKTVQGVATCVCPEEYDGVLCDHWKCSQCDPKAKCHRGTCVCQNNYFGDGKTCRMKIIPKPLPAPVHLPLAMAVQPAAAVQRAAPARSFCASNPCLNGATCLEALDTYFCQCPEDKYGKRCDQTPKVVADLCSKCDIDATCRDGKCICNEGFAGNGFKCRKAQKVSEEPAVIDHSHKTDSSCDFCPENGQCLNNVCVCPPGFENTKRSCVAIDVSGFSNQMQLKAMAPENSVVGEYQSLGCWSDTKDWRNPVMRALESMEGLHPFLNDDYKKRQNPITKCATAAKAYGYKAFAVQNGGQCFSGPNTDKTYTTYGPSTLCRFGVGGTLSNDVYQLS